MMDTEFKVPTFDPKLKVNTKNPVVDSNELRQVETESTPSTVAKEVENAKVESDLTKLSTKCPYIEPKWSKPPDSNLVYSFEVLKGGQIVENIKNLQCKAIWKIGKLPTNDIVMAHPTISRYHCVLQYRPEVTDCDKNNSDSSDDEDDADLTSQKPKIDHGWYLYDLNSTHGSFVNKMKVPPKTYVRIRVGYMLKFGASTRSYIFQGPDFDEEAESELTITEMKELKLKKQLEAKQKLDEAEKRKEEAGISWGMCEDADEETDLSHNPFASTNNEELFLQDPKKTLRGFFEREGLNLEYKVDDVSNGTYTCRVELPITDSVGRSITAEFTHKGKKKECVLQCALEACRILDRNGLLRQATHEPRKRKVESSDDDDEFYDRTTEAEEKRRRKAGPEESVALSYEQLIEEEKKLQSQLQETEKRIERYQQSEKASKQKEAMDVDDLDDFMSGLSSEKQMDKTDVRKCRFEVQRMKNDIKKMQRLINIARPNELPPLKIDDAKDSQAKKKFELPLFGKKKTFGFDKLKQQVISQKPASPNEHDTKQAESVEEFDEDEDDKKSQNTQIESKAKVKEESILAEAPKATKNCDVQTNESTRDASKKRLDTTNNKKEEPKTNEIGLNKSEIYNQKPIQRSVDESVEKLNTEQILTASTKSKTRNRNRNRMRHQIDIDDTEEDKSPQKYSEWMPPSNQTGDGTTDLNSKYGY